MLDNSQINKQTSLHFLQETVMSKWLVFAAVALLPVVLLVSQRGVLVRLWPL